MIEKKISTDQRGRAGGVKKLDFEFLILDFPATLRSGLLVDTPTQNSEKGQLNIRLASSQCSKLEFGGV